jgi:TetR/AcrR family transcriptional regulator
MSRATARDTPSADGARERILAAALQVFAERGFDGARTRDIAERAGANLGLIKYYFNDKEQLWKAAVARAFAELQAGFAEGLQSTNDAGELAWLARTLRQFVHFVARHPEFMRLMNDEGKRNSRRMRWLADRFVRPLNQVVSTHLEHAQAQGLLPPIPSVSLRYIVLGAAGLIFSQAPECTYIAGVDPTDPDFAEQHANALLQVLTGERTASRPAPARARSAGKHPRRRRTPVAVSEPAALAARIPRSGRTKTREQVTIDD